MSGIFSSAACRRYDMMTCCCRLPDFTPSSRAPVLTEQARRRALYSTGEIHWKFFVILHDTNWSVDARMQSLTPARTKDVLVLMSDKNFRWESFQHPPSACWVLREIVNTIHLRKLCRVALWGLEVDGHLEKFMIDSKIIFRKIWSIEFYSCPPSVSVSLSFE